MDPAYRVTRASEFTLEFRWPRRGVTDRSSVDRSYRHCRVDQQPGAVEGGPAVLRAAMAGENFLQLVSRPFGRSIWDALYAPRTSS